MSGEIVMPRLSDSMEEGTILRWMKSVGDEVAVGEELVEIETDKANMVYEADIAGTLVEILAEEGDTLPIGEVIARVGEAGEAPSSGGNGASAEVPDAAPDHETAGAPADQAGAPTTPVPGGGEEVAQEVGPAAASQAPAGEAPASAPPSPPPPADGDGRVKASPIAKRIAGERGIDLSGVRGSGPGGRIIRADVERAASTAAAAAPAAEPQAPAAEPAAQVSTAPPPAQAPAAAGEPEPASHTEPAAEPVAPPAPPSPAAEPAAAEAPAPAPPAAEPERETVPAVPTAGARERPETAKGETQVVELNKTQQTIARRMAESKATAPHFYLQAEIDMSRCVAARAQIKAAAREGEIVPSFNDMVIKACAVALREFPRANGAYRDGKVELYSRVNVGVAVAAPEALIVPTIFDADRKVLRVIATEARALAQRVRDGSITPPELSGGTFTVSNLGMYGISNFHAVINSPQAGILAIGSITERAVVRDGELAAAHMMGVTLACDHRILYGAEGAEFLGRVRELLEEPLGLAL